jgi:hypothetical protein
VSPKFPDARKPLFVTTRTLGKSVFILEQKNRERRVYVAKAIPIARLELPFESVAWNSSR